MSNLTVAIPTNNRLKDLKKCLEALSQQSDPEFEVTVLNNSKEAISDVTDQFHQRLRITVLRDTSQNGAHLFNTCWKKSKSKYIAFLNDDAIPNVNWVKYIKEAIEQGSKIFGGPAITKNDNQ